MNKINCLAIILMTVMVGAFSPVYAGKKEDESKKAAIKSPTMAYSDTETQIHFPSSLGGLNYTNVLNKEITHPGLGITVNYANAEITAEVSIYHLGLKKIQPADMERAFEMSQQDIYALESSGKYKNIEQLKNQPPQITIGAVKFHYAMFSYLAAGKINYEPVIMEIFLTPYKNHFIKVNIMSTKESQQKDVDTFMKALKKLLK